MGPDVRWVGTESGYGRETEWSVMPIDAHYKAASKKVLKRTSRLRPWVI